MTWHVAHIIMYVRYKDVADQAEYPVYENLSLLEAENADRAWEAAEEAGKVQEGDCDGTLVWNDHPAVLVFGGVRKVIACAQAPEHLAPGNRPVHGSELTYSQFTVRGRQAYLQLPQAFL